MDTRYKIVSGVSILTILLIFVLLDSVGVGVFIDIPSLIYVAVFVIVGKLLFENSINRFLIGSAILSIPLGFIATFANIKEPNDIAPTISVMLIIPLYTLIYIYFIENIKIISSLECDQDKKFEESKLFYIAQGVIIVGLLIFLFITGNGVKNYIDPNGLLIFIPLLATINLDQQNKRVLLRSNLVAGSILISFFIYFISILANPSAVVLGSAISYMILTSFYGLYYYLAWLKPVLVKLDIKNIYDEVIIYIVGSIGLFLGFLSLLFFMLK